MEKIQPYAVLAVDDNLLNLKMIEKSLSKEGYQVFVAGNGSEGRSIAREKHPDLILLDIDMPGENGFDVIRKLKQNPATSLIPVIFLTGISDVNAKLKGFDLGAVDYITKPFHPLEVLARVRIHLKLSIATNSLIQVQAAKLLQVSEAQTAMLPVPENFPAARFGVYYKALEEAGGDFYEILHIREFIIGYFVADFSGHDISTSYLTPSIKALLAQNCTPLYSPRESMKMVNAVLKEILPEEKYLTACYLHLNRSTMTMTLVNAGHPPAAYLPVRGDPFLVKSQGDILGMFSDAQFGIDRIKVSKGDRFFVYSDGLVESVGHKNNWMAGARKLLPLFKDLQQFSCRDAPDRLVLQLSAENTPLEDDIVVLCIEV
ncbi:MAG TPA: fused response regulator/phosphatase [Desulfotignum sp.]|nr:fused response regulator/phosphatase [Desulfotignum sp.]